MADEQPKAAIGERPISTQYSNLPIALGESSVVRTDPRVTSTGKSNRMLLFGLELAGKEMAMGLRTERGGDNLPDWLTSAAAKVVSHLDSSQYSEFYRLASNARQKIMGTRKEWQPFDGLLLDAGIDRNNRDHVTALILAVMPKAFKQEKFAQFAAAQESKKRMEKMGVQVQWGPSGKFAVSTATSASIEKGAEHYAAALVRLAKK